MKIPVGIGPSIDIILAGEDTLSIAFFRRDYPNPILVVEILVLVGILVVEYFFS